MVFLRFSAGRWNWWCHRCRVRAFLSASWPGPRGRILLSVTRSCWHDLSV